MPKIVEESYLRSGCDIYSISNTDQNTTKKSVRAMCREITKKTTLMPRCTKKIRNRTFLNLNINIWINEHKKISPRKKNWSFHFQQVFLITFSEGNGRAELEKNTFNDALLCDDEAHIVVLCTCSPFFCTRWVLLKSKKTTFKILLTIKGEKTEV